MPKTPTEPTVEGAQPPPPPKDKASGLSIASMVLGIIGLFMFGLILGPLAIIFGWMEKKNIAEGKSSQAGYGYAQAGFVLGIIDT